MESVFELQKEEGYLGRLKHLKKESKAQWGQMDAAQMLAHLNASYEILFELSQKKKPTLLSRVFFRLVVKPMVLSKRPFKKNLPTSKVLKQVESREFELELSRLRAYLRQVETLGPEAFEQKEHLVFGRLSSAQWDHLLSKHLTHHLNQFGV